MQDLDLKYFGEKLKNIAKSDFGGVGRLGEKLNLKNISNYINGSREPGLKFIYRLFLVGIDINKLLTIEEKGKMSGSEDQITKELKNENDKLKIMLFDLEERLRKYEVENGKLLSQIVTLDQANTRKRSLSP